MQPPVADRRPQSFDRVLSSMCTEPHPAARRAAERFLASNPGDPATYGTVADLEREAVAALGGVAGLDGARGYVTGGGTEANIQAVRAARNRADVRDPVVVAPASAHFSFHKAAELLGVDLRTVPTDADGRADVEAMTAAVEADDRTVLVVAVAGSTEYGRVDPVRALAEVGVDAGVPVHVDAAWGGFYLPFSGHEWDFADAPIDTMTIDPHKVGRAAIPSGGLLARESGPLDALTIETPYLETRSQVSLTGTRSGAGVASAAAALEALWPDGYRVEYERANAEAERLAAALRERGYRTVDPELPLVAFDLPESTFAAVRDAGWKLARTGAGEARIVVMPHVTADVLDGFLDTLDRLDS